MSSKNMPQPVRCAHAVLAALEGDLPAGKLKSLKKALPTFALYLAQRDGAVTEEILQQHIAAGTVEVPRTAKPKQRGYDDIVTAKKASAPHPQFGNAVLLFRHYAAQGDICFVTMPHRETLRVLIE
ncbi:MAG: hypothetical protein OXT65_08485 [Alphaproteobacteria bacterium]|nr:hypothetical protein [Alphaproteobacteria bacterium]